ncbi:hypothetical protein F8O06_02685 [Pseudoclavibacter sp. CFCC 14310]|uniref:hypothetical protein n=1 Tax=Pseudoclavibacter sp. CFCC 14310 TaxID=2615180 RepID=UPI0013016586|nr:hypothetical protein [Pseudoclavibacter sp. CFCC 14310]KAB1647463.1 hypothetical protein F8O06_02685 [Pseudoclavibacter sp. CFCC 14310]
MPSEVTSTGSYSIPLGEVLSDLQGTLKGVDGKVDALGRRQDKADLILEQLAQSAVSQQQIADDVTDLKLRVALLEAAKPMTMPQRVSLWVSLIAGLTGTIGLIGLLIKLAV